MHLTALKKLNTLKLGALPAGCADELTTDLLPKLPELASLSLHWAVFTSLRELSGLSTLTYPTKLQLTGWGRDAKMRDEDLQVLRPLRELCDLEADLFGCCSSDMLQRFTTSMPNLTRLDHIRRSYGF